MFFFEKIERNEGRGCFVLNKTKHCDDCNGFKYLMAKLLYEEAKVGDTVEVVGVESSPFWNGRRYKIKKIKGRWIELDGDLVCGTSIPCILKVVKENR